MSTTKRKFPKEGNDIRYTRKQMLEMNILIMQAFFEPFTAQELNILLETAIRLNDVNDYISIPLKYELMEVCKISEITSLNTKIREIEEKRGFIKDGKKYRLSPILFLKKDVTKVSITIDITTHGHKED